MTEGNTRRIQARQVRRNLGEITPSNSSAQPFSPLFSTIPPEIRNAIFELALKNSLTINECPLCEMQCHVPLPHGRGGPVIDTRLLLTCRRIYCETAAIPLRLTAIHICWGRSSGDMQIRRFTARNVLHLHEVYLDLIQPDTKRIFRVPQFQPSHLAVRFYLASGSTKEWDGFLQSSETTYWPASLETLTLIISIVKPDKEWKQNLEKLCPLTLHIHSEHSLIQKQPVLFELEEKPPLPRKNMPRPQHSAKIKLSQASNNSSKWGRKIFPLHLYNSAEVDRIFKTNASLDRTRGLFGRLT